jgi:hypothetical protein
MSFDTPIRSINVISAEVEKEDKRSFEAAVVFREFYDKDLHIAAYLKN